MKTFEFRLFVNKEQSILLMACLRESRTIYNGMLEMVKTQYEQDGTFSSKVEDLAICNMVKNHHLSKAICDASWGAFLGILEAKAENAGHQVIRVNPRFTSQKCHQCGEIVQKSLSVRTHVCPFCGYVADRDVNAAKNILKAGAQPSGVNVRQ